MAKKKVNRRAIPLGTNLDPEVMAALRAFCAERNEGIREVIEMALRRHFASPPPKLEIPPLPPLKPAKPK
jgi:spore coat protein CotF